MRLLLFHFWHGSLDILPVARLGALGVAPGVAGDLEVMARTAVSIAFKRSCKLGQDCPAGHTQLLNESSRSRVHTVVSL